MVKKFSCFDQFLVVTVLVDIFDPSSSDVIDFVSRNIIDGLDDYGMLKSH